MRTNDQNIKQIELTDDSATEDAFESLPYTSDQDEDNKERIEKFCNDIVKSELEKEVLKIDPDDEVNEKQAADTSGENQSDNEEDKNVTVNVAGTKEKTDGNKTGYKTNSFNSFLPEFTDNALDRELWELLPIVRTCSIEHSYCRKNNNRDGTTNNIRERGTLKFTTEDKSQETKDGRAADDNCLSSEAVACTIGDSCSKSEDKRESASPHGSSSSADDVIPDIDCDEDSSFTESSMSCDSFTSVDQKQFSEKSGMPILVKYDMSQSPNSNQTPILPKPPTLTKMDTNPNNLSRSLKELNKKISKMEKIILSKWSNKERDDSANIPLPKLTKMTTGEDIQQEKSFILPMPTLTKMVAEKKNWKIEYLDEDSRSVGLDEILTQASEMNAQNFSKAIEGSLGSMEVKGNDSSSIVLQIPAQKRKSVDSTEEAGSTGPAYLRKLKLDLLKRFIDEDKPEKPKVVPQSPTTSVGSMTPKKPEIKVKSVANINEEFGGTVETLRTVVRRTPSKKSEENSSDATVKDCLDETEKIIQLDKSKLEKETKQNEISVHTGAQENSVAQENTVPATVVPLTPVIPAGLAPKAPGSEDSNLIMVHYHNGSFFRVIDSQNQIFENLEKESPQEKKKLVPFILKRDRKKSQSEPSQTLTKPFTTINLNSLKYNSPQFRPIPPKALESLPVNTKRAEGVEMPLKVKSIEKKILTTPTERFVKVVRYETNGREKKKALPEYKSVVSLTFFSKILANILPEKWSLLLDGNFGLQIIKTHVDSMLNPTIMMSIVIGSNGKVKVNVRGRQLERSHHLFYNLCDEATSQNKISINYVMSLLNKLRFHSVCLGCDDLSLKKYWKEEGSVEHYSEFQQTFRSHVCELVVPLGRKRCCHCVKMLYSLNTRKRRDLHEKKIADRKVKQFLVKTPEPSPKEIREISDIESGFGNASPGKGVKRKADEISHDSVSVPQKAANESKFRKDDKEVENFPQTQEEVLSFMGLTRKDSLCKMLRKSKREKKVCIKFD